MNIKRIKILSIGLIAIIMFSILAKYILFYNLIDISSYKYIVIVISFVLTIGMILAFKNMRIASVIYFLLSLLMFADWTYYSFFGRYLSVALIGATEVVGEISESIAEVIKPVNFLLLVDSMILMAISFIGLKKPSTILVIKKGSRKVIAIFILIILTVTFVLGNGGGIATSIKNQEFYNYHISDIANTAFGAEEGSFEAFKDTYAGEIDGELFGVARDRNLVFIQIESFMNFVIGREYNEQELTPNLNALIKNDSTHFNNFYQQVGSGNTSDAEFAANNSIYGTVLSYTYKVYGETNYFRGLPVLLKEKGYDTAVFHAFEDMTFWNRVNAYPALGFDKCFGGLKDRAGYYEMTEWMGWGLTDSEFFKQTIPLMKENLKEPYYAFVNTLSNHHPFKMLEHYKFIELLPEDQDTFLGNYLQSVAYTDYSIGLFLEELKAEGMYEDSIFVLYGDHAGLTHSEEIDESMERLLGEPYENDTLLRVPLIIHIPNATEELPETISVSGGHLDIMPTVAYLMGFNDLDTVYFGHNLYNVKENLVPEQTFVKRGSFIFDDIMYEMALDGVYENGRAWNMHTKETIPLDTLKRHYEDAMEIIHASEYILKNDVLRKIYIDNEGLSALSQTGTRREFPEKVARCLDGSLESLDLAYEKGYRYLEVSLKWDSDGKACYTVNEAGITVMNHEKIIEWMMEHEEAVLVVRIYGEYVHSLDNTLTFFGQLGDSGTQTGKRMILVAENTKDYTGRHDIFLDISKSKQSNKELSDFITINDVWAIMVDEHDYNGKRAEFTDIECAVYVSSENDGEKYERIMEN